MVGSRKGLFEGLSVERIAALRSITVGGRPLFSADGMCREEEDEEEIDDYPRERTTA